MAQCQSAGIKGDVEGERWDSLDLARTQQIDVDSRLEALREQGHGLGQDLATQTPTSRDTKELASIAQHLNQVIANGDPRQAKALLRLLIVELRVNNRNEILPTYRVTDPSVCAPASSVELAGLEPATFRLPAERSPS
jgi:hypothetical protein